MMPENQNAGWYQRFFAWALARGSGPYEDWMRGRKKRLLADVRGDVLEIGPGTGVNLSYFSPQIRWTGIEPNPFMHKYLRTQAIRLGMTVELRCSRAESMKLEDASFDAVIGTLVLCSVQDVEVTLRQILRVLKPGGRYFFIEHIAAPAGTQLRRIQRLVRPVWKLAADGCCPDRETLQAIEKADFASMQCEQFLGPLPIVRPHIAGVATKGG